MTEVTEDEFIDDPLAAIDKLSDLLESQSETELTELSEEVEKKQSLKSRILEDDSDLPKPKQDRKSVV